MEILQPSFGNFKFTQLFQLFVRKMMYLGIKNLKGFNWGLLGKWEWFRCAPKKQSLVEYWSSIMEWQTEDLIGRGKMVRRGGKICRILKKGCGDSTELVFWKIKISRWEWWRNFDNLFKRRCFERVSNQMYKRVQCGWKYCSFNFECPTSVGVSQRIVLGSVLLLIFDLGIDEKFNITNQVIPCVLAYPT